MDCIWQDRTLLLSEYETNSRMMDFSFFSPVTIEAYRKGELLEIGNKTVVYLDQLPIESQKEKKILLLSWTPSSQAMAFYCQRFGTF